MGAAPVFGLSVPCVAEITQIEYIPCPSFVAKLGDTVKAGAFVLAQEVRIHTESAIYIKF